MSEKLEQLVEMSGRLADDFATRAAEHDRANSFPFENVEALKQAGYTALVVPERHGGLGGDLLDFIRCQERLAQGCGPTALAINMHLFGIGSMVERAPVPERPEQGLFLSLVGRQRKLIGGGLSEPESGGDWGLFATRARRDGEAYVLNGRKVFTSLSPVVDFFMVMATVEDDGPLSSATLPVARNTPGLELVETWDAMGMRATASHDLILKNVRVPAATIADRRPVGPLGADAISLFAWFELSIAAVYTGVAIAAMSFTREFAQRFKPITLERPISYLPGVQFAMAQAQALLAQSRALYLGTAREYLENRDSFSGEDGLVRVIIPKYVAVNNAIAIVDHCMEIAGAHGFLRRNPLERLFRDVRAGINHPLSNARAREFIGKSALGIPMSTTPRW
ncbi:MAG TPA: acyl-CoA dehydrogenase family protein [Candidatus Binataceae bacterium]|nr:acyl-CoA dehydrogenase family protein [Candidatus Binataceae bacterium]